MGLLGVTVLPEWAQSEGIEAVLDRLEDAGASEIATSPYVMEPDPKGSREPPADGGQGFVRLLDRPLWGERALKVRTAPSYAPDASLYERTAYRPPAPDALTAREGETVARFIEAATARGLRVWLQVQAAIPPGYRVQFSGVADGDRPLDPDDLPVEGRVDANASLAAPDITAYTCALIKDLCAAYPLVEGVRVDWPEYPPYAFGSLFFDFSPHALRVAHEMGLDVDRMRRDTLALRERLTGGALDIRHAPDPLDEAALDLFPGAADLLHLKRTLVRRLIEALVNAVPAGKTLVPQAFPPPLNRLSGFAYEEIAPLVPAIGVKLYTMHWPMILGDWHGAMGGGVPLAALLNAAFDTGATPPREGEAFAYPPPDAPHPAGDDAIARKIGTAKALVGETPIYAFTHAYGPLQDVMRRAEAAWQASGGAMWVNRYGYLSDDKLAALGQLVRA